MVIGTLGSGETKRLITVSLIFLKKIKHLKCNQFYQFEKLVNIMNLAPEGNLIAITVRM